MRIRFNIKRAITNCLLLALLLLPLPANTQDRDIALDKIKTVEGGKELKLYDKSYALVIGVSDYTAGWPNLLGPKDDIEAVAATLERHGFRVTLVVNPGSTQLDKAFKDFISAHGRNIENRLLFYFAGHGHTVKQSYGDEIGYIVPADAPDPRRDQNGFLDRATSMRQIELYAESIQSKHALFLFDSCFSGSFFPRGSAPESISYKTSRHVRQFITSGSADEEVPDRSIFRRQFIEALEGEADGNNDGYVTGSELGVFLQDRVVNYSRNAQHPQYGKIRNPNLDKGDFVFKLLRAGNPPGTTGINSTPQIARADLWQEELTFWNSIMNSNDPEDFKDYLANYPAGRFAGIARRRITMLSMATSNSANTAGKADTKPGTVVRNRNGMELVYIPPGEFLMGSQNGSADESPVHRVTIHNGYWMGKYEVTQSQWRSVMGKNNPSYFKGDNLPVEQVSWNDANSFIAKLNAKNDGYLYRLPSETEWEYACRAGTAGDYAGNLGSMAWYGVNSDNRTHPVGQRQPNAFGLYDMHGNVWEWCRDWYHKSYVGAPNDGHAWLRGGELKHRMLRGGSWGSIASFLRSAYRDREEPDKRGASIGFRVMAVARI